MAAPDDPLQGALGVIAAAPHSAAALTLYALMERMAAGGHLDAAWQAAKARMDELLRAG